MCGIAGYLNLDVTKEADQVMVKAMTDCIAHRGPDGEGFYIKNNLGLGHRRLSIIDMSTGDQPMLSDDENIVLIFNGEIYNYIELREELVGLGYDFKTSSDTEVIIKAYQHWGHDCQQYFNGMWAFALWDKDKEELFLSRDRFGEKPLHYYMDENTFVFGSEIKSIFRFGIQKQIRTELTEIYLALTNIPAPDTFFKDIYKLMPGSYLLIKQGKLIANSYWKFPQVKEEEMLTNANEVHQTFDKLFTDAVKIRMRSDVAFGAFLSGGLDSSAVVSVMAKHSGYPINTFTIGFESKGFDESGLAEIVAKKFGTEHSMDKVLPVNFEEELNRTSYHYDEPFGDSSAIPTDIVSRHAAQKVKMVLTGDGGDEALGGYNSYKAVKIVSKVNIYFPGVLKNVLIASIWLGSKMCRPRLRYKLNNLRDRFKVSQIPFHQQLARSNTFVSLADIKLLTKGISGLIPVESYFENLMKHCSFKDDFYKLMYVHYHHHLPNDFLVKVDRMSMANSIETRLPFLDYRLVEFMAGVHKDVKMEGWELKSVLRNSIGKNLPEEILNAPKRGFAVPLREWFKDKEFNTVLNDNLICVKNMLDEKVILKIIEENRSGEKDNGNFIWTLLQLEKQIQQYKEA